MRRPSPIQTCGRWRGGRSPLVPPAIGHEANTSKSQDQHGPCRRLGDRSNRRKPSKPDFPNMPHVVCTRHSNFLNIFLSILIILSHPATIKIALKFQSLNKIPFFREVKKFPIALRRSIGRRYPASWRWRPIAEVAAKKWQNQLCHLLGSTG
jgi:hypothetical protein